MTAIYSPQTASPRVEQPPALITRIVLPLDGSVLAERAIPSAVVLARRLQAEVLLVRAYGGSSSLPSGNARYNIARHATGEPLHVASLYLARMEREMRARGVRTYSWLLQWDPDDAILDVAMRGPADLILLATSLGAGDHALAESVAAHLVLRAATPLLLLGPASKSLFERPECAGVRVLAVQEERRPNSLVRPYTELLADAFAGRAVVLRTPRLQVTMSADGSAEQALAVAVRRAMNGRTDGQGDRGAVEIDAGEISLDQAARFVRAAADLFVLGRPEPAEEREAFVARVGDLLRASGIPLLVVP